MVYGFHDTRRTPDKIHRSFKGKQKDRGLFGSNGDATLRGWVGLIQDQEGFTGEVSIIGDPAQQGKYVGNGRSFLFYQSRALNWVIPVEIQTPLDAGMAILYGKKRMVPRPTQVSTGAPCILEDEMLHLPELSTKEQKVLDRIVNSVRGGLSNLILRRVDRKEGGIEERFTPELQEIMQQGYFCGQVEIRF
ncbi:hypothetical protein KY310_00440 [Candidatus Woesearchaeota archaeon]|nr:hypothetical protein [Candidatus Woesearchaeota archaeon]